MGVRELRSVVSVGGFCALNSSSVNETSVVCCLAFFHFLRIRLAGYSAHGGWSVPHVSDVRWSFCPTSSIWTNPNSVNPATRGVFAPAFRKEEVTAQGRASFCLLVVTRGGVAPAPESGRVRHQVALPRARSFFLCFMFYGQ